MSEDPRITTEENPRVFVAIPTGPPKKYALAYMFAALQNLDYPNREVHFAATRYAFEKNEDGFPNMITALQAAIDLHGPCHIHWTWLREDEMVPYGPVLRNKALLRGLFLDGDCDYFLMVGGDNPPPRNTIRRLLELDADVACGLVYQRPYRGIGNMAYPLVYTYSWMLDDIDPTLPRHLRAELEKTWRASMFYLPIYLNPEWTDLKVVTEFTGGDGCMLVRRAVLENVGFYLPETFYHSEDVNFFTWAKYLGYSTKCDMTLHVPHHDESGEAW